MAKLYVFTNYTQHLLNSAKKFFKYKHRFSQLTI